jgi:PhnB protein
MEIKEIAPYLIFDGNCAEACRFYQSVLGGKLDIQTYADSPAKEHVPADSHARVIHARLSIGQWGVMASDAPSTKEYERAQGTSITVTIGSEPDAKRIFDALVAGGRATMPYGKTFWSPGFGMLVDRFGVPWMVNTEQAA